MVMVEGGESGDRSILFGGDVCVQLRGLRVSAWPHFLDVELRWGNGYSRSGSQRIESFVVRLGTDARPGAEEARS